MTTEEKAKAYDEALERAKDGLTDKKFCETEDTIRSVVEYIFPQLAESEDEKIRKEIIEYLKLVDKGEGDYAHPMVSGWIAYLEKQKDLDKMIVVSPEVWDKAISDAYENGEKDGEKQKEHQFCPDAPKEKSVGGYFLSSSHKDKNLDELSQEYVDGVKQYNQEPTWDLVQTAVCYGANWQKEQFEKNRLANCDALSKEECDRETDFAMEIIEKEHRQPTFNDAINYGMRKQKEQKPAEWGEEDENMLWNIISIVGESKSIQADEMLDWLKSLRPSWKPSEEQMEAFSSYIKDFQEKAEAAVGGWNNFDVMIRLYEQLKKL